MESTTYASTSIKQSDVETRVLPLNFFLTRGCFGKYELLTR